MSHRFRVLKFGGTSLAGPARIAAAAEIVAREAPRGSLVVASAMGGATDALLRLVAASAAGAPAVAADLFAELVARHRVAALGLPLARRSRLELLGILEDERRRIVRRLEAVGAAGRAVDADRDEVASAGEILSSRFLAAALRARGVRSSWVDPRELVATDDRFGDARPDEARIAAAVAARIVPRLDAGKCVVTGGFVGRHPESGATTTLGRGGSDWSASLLGAALDAAVVEIWTDVDGIMTADPRIDPAARLVERIGWDEAEAIARGGAKVLHPESVAPARLRGIPLRIRNSFRPDGPGTLVGAPAGRGVPTARSRGARSAGRGGERGGWAGK